MGERLKHITDVVCRLLQGEGTAEERVRWSREVEEARCGEVVKRLEDEEYVERRLQGYGRWNEREGFRRFVAAVERIRRQRRMWRRMAWVGVAAGVACVMCVGILLRKEEPVVVAAKPVNEVIAPGSTKATLRLAGGETVHITGDTMHIARTEESQIRYEDGKLTYASGRKAAELVYNELEVPVAGECSLVLDDGTQVWVNADSRLRYPVQFVGEERKVFLEGEAYFVVAKGTQPFVVSTSRGDVRVLGTTFNVKAYEEDGAMAATLVEGKVDGGKGGQWGQWGGGGARGARGGEGKGRGGKGEGGMDWAPGEQGTVTAAGVMEKREVDVDEFVGWKKGIYVFKRQRLENIMRDLSRWYGVEVFFQNQALRALPFTGNLRRYEDINGFLDVLERTGELKYRINDNTVIIYK